MLHRLFMLFCSVLLLATLARAAVDSSRQRLVILADMGNEPDEEQQMVHMLMYANEFDIEGLIAVTGKYLRKEPRPDLFFELIEAYSLVVDNLSKHADGWPSVAFLQSKVAAGQPFYGTANVGLGKSSEGSRLLESVFAKEDPRPIYIVVNAGSNTLAQALIDYEAKVSSEDFKVALGKLRIFENGSQDNAGSWICNRYPDIHWIRSNYQTYCYGGPSFDGVVDNKGDRSVLGPYTWEPYEYSGRGQHQWAMEHINGNHGALGAKWPLRYLGRQGRLAYIEGGGTIPWLCLVNKGLSDINNPWWGGWSGLATREKVENYWSKHRDIRVDEMKVAPFGVYAEAADTWKNPENGDVYEDSLFSPIWRWRRAFYNDFVSRMDWCLNPYEKANHNPIAAIDGDASDDILILSVKPDQRLTFDASGTIDPDGDEVEYSWYCYKEAGTYEGEVAILGAATSEAELEIPADSSGKEIHLILEVKDKNPIASLFDYRRIVFNVE